MSALARHSPHQSSASVIGRRHRWVANDDIIRAQYRRPDRRLAPKTGTPRTLACPSLPPSITGFHSLEPT